MSNQKKSKQRNALGKGLDALLGDSAYESSKELETTQPVRLNFLEINLTQIEANPFQPRAEFDQQALQALADSITLHGIIQPVTVRRLTDQKYQLISGERRLQASKLAGAETIPAFVRSANDQEMLEMSLVENIQRKDLNALEIAFSYQRLITECNLKQEELAQRMGKDRTTVTNYLRLLKLPPVIQIGLRDGKISMGHARALINVEHVDAQLAIFKKIGKEELSVRKTESLVKSLLTGTKSFKATPENKELPHEIRELQNRLASHFGTKVEVKTKAGEKGEIKIPFVSVDDLNRILDLIDL